MKKRIAAATLAVVGGLVWGLAPSVEAFPSGISHHYTCEGTFGFDHGQVFDGATGNIRWYHSMVRTYLGGNTYKVVRHVYRQTSTMQYPLWDHQHQKSDCGPLG